MEILAQKTIGFILATNLRLNLNIMHLILSYHLDNSNLPIPFQAVFLSIKVVVYDLLVLLLLSSLKIIFRESGLITLLFVASLIAFSGAAFLIFLGLFQVLFA